uniref:Uncharacterized protein n=1 Tax=viral metagenome TaxID=1070528 RepID=A0A6C0H5T6_9ZZZZ
MVSSKKCENAKMNVGTRAQVWHGTACRTSGGLHKKDLIMNKHGRIVSRKKHHSEKRGIIDRLFKKGYKPFKGKFGVSKGHGDYGSRSSLKSYHSKRGGGPGTNYALSPASVSGLNSTDPSVNVQFAAGMGGRRKKRHTRKNRKHGGSSPFTALSPSGIDGQGITDYKSQGSNSVQFAAGMAA